MKPPRRSSLFVRFILCLAVAVPSLAGADLNYHTVGWTNVFVPGGGELLFGNYTLAAEQAGLELGTFIWGYSLSAREPFTLDGVPEDLPSPNAGFLEKSGNLGICIKRSPSGVCIRRGYNGKNSLVGFDTPQDITKPMFADILQEIGLKAHIVNVYDSYRTAAKNSGVDFTVHQIDATPTKDLFLAPFDRDNIFSPWVFIPLTLTGLVLYYSYQSLTPNDYPALPPFNRRSNLMYDATYTGVFPVGSGAPEEMFYRGFLQGELYSWTGTPWVSVPVSTALYALSHSPDAQLGAAVSGLYLGFLTYHENGQLKKGITYHFWSDIMTGLYTIAVLKLGQNQASAAPPPTVNLNFEF